MTHIDLFSGIGGFALAAQAAGLETVLFCEKEPFCREVLTHHWPGVPIVEDVNDVEGISEAWEHAVCGKADFFPARGGGVLSGETVADTGEQGGQCKRSKQNGDSPQPGQSAPRRDDLGGRDNAPFLLTAGVPCQPASAAGKRLGAADDRWLWPQTLKVVEALQPEWCIFENPSGILSLAESARIPGVEGEADFPGRTLLEITTALVRLGYDFARDSDGNPCFPVIPAAAVGAPHRRDRVWIVCQYVGNASSNGSETGLSGPERSREERDTGEPEHRGGTVGDSPGPGREPRGTASQAGERSQAQQRPGRRNGGTLPDWSSAVLQRGADGTTRLTKPGLRLLAHGIPRRTSKLRGLGNSIVPAVALEIIEAILKP